MWHSVRHAGKGCGCCARPLTAPAVAQGPRGRWTPAWLILGSRRQAPRGQVLTPAAGHSPPPQAAGSTETPLSREETEAQWGRPGCRLGLCCPAACRDPSVHPSWPRLFLLPRNRPRPRAGTHPGHGSGRWTRQTDIPERGPWAAGRSVGLLAGHVGRRQPVRPSRLHNEPTQFSPRIFPIKKQLDANHSLAEGHLAARLSSLPAAGQGRACSIQRVDGHSQGRRWRGFLSVCTRPRSCCC